MKRPLLPPKGFQDQLKVPLNNPGIFMKEKPNNKMKRTLLIVTVIFSWTFALGQESLWSVNYNPAIAFGDLSNYADGTSWRGWSFEGRRFTTDEVSVGGYIGYNGFYEERARALYDIDNVTINSQTWRYVYTLPVLVTAHYYIGEGMVRPYVGVGTGVYYIEQELQFSSFRLSNNYWKFGLAPELGLFIPFGISSNVGALLNAKFHQVFYNEQNIDNLNYINYNFGIAVSY